MVAATLISPIFVPWFFKVVMSWKRDRSVVPDAGQGGGKAG
jgi:hypothetical protein